MVQTTWDSVPERGVHTGCGDPRRKASNVVELDAQISQKLDLPESQEDRVGLCLAGNSEARSWHLVAQGEARSPAYSMPSAWGHAAPPSSLCDRHYSKGQLPPLPRHEKQLCDF